MQAPLSLEGPYSIGEAAFRLIQEQVAKRSPQTILEFGSGASTARLALAFPDARITAIDHDIKFAQEAEGLCRAAEVGDRVDIQACHLRWYMGASGAYQCYSEPKLPHAVDAVIIDGPPSFTRRGREYCLHLAAPYLREGSLIFLDDYQRLAEQRIALNWERTFPECFRSTPLNVGHGVLMMEVVAPLKRPRPSLRVGIDSTLANARRGLGSAVRTLRSLRQR